MQVCQKKGSFACYLQEQAKSQTKAAVTICRLLQPPGSRSSLAGNEKASFLVHIFST